MGVKMTEELDYVRIIKELVITAERAAMLLGEISGRLIRIRELSLKNDACCKALHDDIENLMDILKCRIQSIYYEKEDNKVNI